MNDAHSKKEHDSKISKILKFGVNQVNIEQDRAIQHPQMLLRKYRGFLVIH